MSNFKHEHILRLLGVCLDNDPNYIIMELMEGGDLLSYLRSKRTSLVCSIYDRYILCHLVRFTFIDIKIIYSYIVIHVLLI